MSPKPGFRRGILTTQSRPARKYAHSNSHRTFLCGLSMDPNLAKSPLFALCIFQASSFSQTPLQHARPGRGSLGGRVARDASPSGDCDPRRQLHGFRHWAGCTRCFPVRGLRPIYPRPRGLALRRLSCTRCFPVRGLRHGHLVRADKVVRTTRLHEMLPRQGIATGPARPGEPPRPRRWLHEMLPRQGIATTGGAVRGHPRCGGCTRCFPVRGLRREMSMHAFSSI